MLGWYRGDMAHPGGQIPVRTLLRRTCGGRGGVGGCHRGIGRSCYSVACRRQVRLPSTLLFDNIISRSALRAPATTIRAHQTHNSFQHRTRMVLQGHDTSPWWGTKCRPVGVGLTWGGRTTAGQNECGDRDWTCLLYTSPSPRD